MKIYTKYALIWQILLVCFVGANTPTQINPEKQNLAQIALPCTACGEDIIVGYITSLYAKAYENYQIHIESIQVQFPINLESSAILKITPQKSFATKNTGTLVALVEKNQSQLSIPITYSVQADITILRALSLIASHSDITEQNAKQERITLDQLKSMPLAPNALGEVSARSIITPNAIITIDKTQDRILVHKGEMITGTLTNENLSIQTMLEALQNGTKNQIIKALNPATKKVLRVRVISAGMVEVL